MSPLLSKLSKGEIQTSWHDRNDRFHAFKMDAKSEPEITCANRIPADQTLRCLVSFPGLVQTLPLTKAIPGKR